MLKSATLQYTPTSIVHVKPHAGLPIPAEFDFHNPIRAAKEIAALMSNASGGHVLNNCRLTYNRNCQTATVTALGMAVHYAPEGFKLFSEGTSADPNMVRDVITRYQNGCTTVELGNVVADQYGKGWLRAKWS